MTEAQALIALPRTPGQILCEFESASAERDMYMKLMANLAAYDIRPIRVYGDGTVERVGPDIWPDELRKAYVDAATRVVLLQHEYARARRHDVD